LVQFPKFNDLAPAAQQTADSAIEALSDGTFNWMSAGHGIPIGLKHHGRIPGLGPDPDSPRDGGISADQSALHIWRA